MRERLRKFEIELKLIKKKAEKVDIKEKTDLIICSHVIQHVGRKSREIILRKAFKWLKKNGKFLLLFSKMEKDKIENLIVWKENDKVKASEIPEKLFEFLARNPIEGILHVKKFKVQEVLKKLEDIGFKIIEIRPYFIDYKFQKKRGKEYCTNCFGKLDGNTLWIVRF